jgi:hypothetical protein
MSADFRKKRVRRAQNRHRFGFLFHLILIISFEDYGLKTAKGRAIF